MSGADRFITDPTRMPTGGKGVSVQTAPPPCTDWGPNFARLQIDVLDCPIRKIDTRACRSPASRPLIGRVSPCPMARVRRTSSFPTDGEMGAVEDGGRAETGQTHLGGLILGRPHWSYRMVFHSQLTRPRWAISE